MEPVYKMEIKVSGDVVDGNGHVNNVAYVKWMQDVAVSHSNATGCTQATIDIDAKWVVRTHHVEYLRPAFNGDTIIALTWVSDFRKVRSLRKYKFIRLEDSAVLAQAETDWVFVDSEGRPMAIPDDIKNLFVVTGDELELSDKLIIYK